MTGDFTPPAPPLASPYASPPIPGTDAARRELWDLYQIAIEEYRFQVRLNADRIQHYLVLNAGILAAGAGLLKLGDVAHWAVFPIFVMGIVTSLLAVRAIEKGRSYYHRARDKVLHMEDALALDKSHRLGTTDAMQSGGRSEEPRAWNPLSWNVTTTLVRIFQLFALANAVLLGFSFRHSG